MPPVIEAKKDELFALCRKFNVRTLELFGSAARGEFDPEESDLDFLVDYAPLTPGTRGDAYLGLLFGLQDLFSRRIDLLETGAIRNIYLLRSINKDRTVLYAD